MSKILSSLLLTIIISTISFSQTQKEKFDIKGKLSGFDDSTWIYLDDVTTSFIPVDSVRIINNQFHFTGFIKENAKQFAIVTKDFSDYKYFWLENSDIVFTAEKGKFKDAIITGSKTQNDQNQLDEAIKNTGKEKEQSILFIRNHPNSIISADILNVYASTWGKDTAAILYHHLSDKLKNTYYGKDIFDFITLNKNIQVGDKYVDFTEPNITGKNVSLSDFHGKIVLLEFWGSWCQPCRKGNPALVKIYNEFKDKGFDILGVVADDTKELWLDAVQEDGLSWQNVSDLKGPKNKAALIYGISYYPANFLIDRNGIIIAKDLRGESLKSKLDEVFK